MAQERLFQPEPEIGTCNFFDGRGYVRAHRHGNGGGWVADTAYAAPTAYVGPFAKIYDRAHVLGNARIIDHARISGKATVKDNAIIGDHVHVSCYATVKNNAKLFGSMRVGAAKVFGDDTTIIGNADLSSCRDCLDCPCMLSDNYGSCHETPCIDCVGAKNFRQRKFPFYLSPQNKPLQLRNTFYQL